MSGLDFQRPKERWRTGGLTSSTNPRGSRRPARRRRLVWRVYLFGVLLLVAVAVAAGLVGAAFGKRTRGELPLRILTHIAGDLEPLLDDPAALEEELARAQGTLMMELSVFATDGRLLATTGDDGAEPLMPAELARIGGGTFRLEGSELRYVTPLPDPCGTKRRFELVRGEWRPAPCGAVAGAAPSAYLIGQRPKFEIPLERPLAILGAVLAVLALVSLPFARTITAPLERLTATAEELGRGHLGVRSGLRRNDEVGTLALAFDEMAVRLEALVRSEKELLANVSHELRTPLARIRVALELAQEGDLDEARRYLGDIGADLLELDGLIEDVLTAARLDVGTGGSPPLRLAPLDPADLAERAAARFRAEHPDRGLEVRIEGRLPTLRGDPVLLRRVLDNLLDNARKYSDGEVLLSARAVAEAVEFSVQDQGIGIDPDDLSRLFSPFFRSDRSRTRRSGGVGLGLTLARRIVEAHGGSLGAESAPEKGSIFRVRVPLPHSPR